MTMKNWNKKEEPISERLRDDEQIHYVNNNHTLMYNPKTRETGLVLDVFIVDINKEDDVEDLHRVLERANGAADGVGRGLDAVRCSVVVAVGQKRHTCVARGALGLARDVLALLLEARGVLCQLGLARRDPGGETTL